MENKLDLIVHFSNEEGLTEDQVCCKIFNALGDGKSCTLVAPQGDWISVKSEVPEEGGRYWGYVEEINDLGISHFQWNVYFDPKEKRWSDNLKTLRVTHWMPLPPPPINKA